MYLMYGCKTTQRSLFKSVEDNALEGLMRMAREEGFQCWFRDAYQIAVVLQS